MRLYRQMYPNNVDERGNLKPGSLSPSDVTLSAYGGSQIKHRGAITIPCSYKGESTRALFYVTDIADPAIIGLPTSTNLKLLTFNFSIHKNVSTPRNDTVFKEQPTKNKQDVISQYHECFSGVGKFHGEYHILLHLSQPPVVHPPRRVPISVKDDIKRELDEMVRNDIIAMIEEGEPTQWVTTLVYRSKPNGRLRLRLDPKDLNAALQSHFKVTLTYFDPKKETILQVDASMKSLGAALTQDHKAVAFTSKALTDVEARYANIERELLAVVYGCEKFHTYLYGRSFTVYTDHEPLESIHLKH